MAQLIGLRDPAWHLLRVLLFTTEKRKHRNRIIAWLCKQSGILYGSSVNSGGCTCFNRPIGRPNPRKLSARAMEGGSPALPAGYFDSPTCTKPDRKVPVVSTTVFAVNRIPS